MNKKVGRVLCLLFLFGMNSEIQAQLNNSFFKLYRPDTTAGIVRLQLENLNYLRNLEYKTHIDEGRTLFGYQFAPEINYQISDQIQMSVGLFAQKDFGGEDFYALKPLYSLQYRNGASTIRFGNLFGSVQHNLIEPLYDPERIIENRLENGMQFLLNRKRLFVDCWLDWRKMIYPNSNHPEAFTAGFVAEPKLIVKDNLKLSLPFSALVFHQGGEIDTSHQRTYSNFNFDYAAKLILKPKSTFWDSIDFQAHFVYYEDISVPAINFIDGLGQYISAAAYFKNFGVMLNYWDAHQFLAPAGDVIFQSVSFKNPALYTQHYRKMLMTRLFFQKEIGPNLKFLFRANYVHDLNHGTNDVITELYFRWTPTMVLGKIKL